MMKRELITVAILAILVFSAGACHRKPPAPVVPSTPELAPAPPGPPTCRLTAEPASVEQGHALTLSWTSKDATEITLEPGLGEQLAEGSTSVSPRESTTYSLTATGPGGTTSCSARVTVSVPAPSASSVSESNLGGEPPLSAQLRDAFFDLDKSDLRQDAREALTADANVLKAHPGTTFAIEGYCDERGSEEYNLGLGERRADVTQDFLTSLGVPAARLSTISYGKTRQSCTEHTEECWEKNRKAHLAPK